MMSSEVELEEEKETTPFMGILSEEEEKSLVDFLTNEITLCESERSGEEDEWKIIRRQRHARTETKRKDTPWPNASNVCPPGAKIATDSLYGMAKNSFGAKKPTWAIEAMQSENPKDIQTARTLERYFQLLADSKQDLNKRSKDREILEEMVSMGTSFVKVSWLTEEGKVTFPSPEGVQTTATVTFHDGPEWVVIPREDAFYRMREKDIQKARWWAQRIELEEQDVEERMATGKWNTIKDWKEKLVETEALDHEIEADDMSGGVPLQRRVYRFFEVFVRWDIEPKDGVWEDLVVIFSKKSGDLLRVQINPLGLRPVREFNFLKRSFRMDGEGVGHAALHMQEELSTIHNQRQDGVHLSTLKMFIARRNCGIKPKEVLRPGKIFFVDDVRADFMPLAVGEVYPSSLQAENMAWMYMQRATLMNDAMSGFPDATMKTRDSIGLQTMRMKASSGVIGAILEGVEDSYSDLGMFTFYQIVLNKDTILENEKRIARLSEKELAELEEAISSIPLNEIPMRLRFSVRTADIEQTFEMRRQNTLTLVSLYSMFQKQMLPLVVQLTAVNPQTGQPMLPPPVREFVMRLVTGNSRLMEKVFEFFGEDDTSKYVPEYEKMEMMLDIKKLMEEQMMQYAAQGGLGGQGGQGQIQGAVGGPQAGPTGPIGGNGQEGMAGSPQTVGGGNVQALASPGAGGGGVQALPSAGLSGSLA
jgi:hypothetical protein